ncbi:tumor suppressor candidate 2-like [Lineus longissimus]|uniref:tumor suppressor candidate 2-like n=1 Tax=Lineus longissimus TaxID=88925 RepID=UPI002B4C7C34
MGQTTTKIAKKVTNYWYGDETGSAEEMNSLAISRFGATPFVYKRRGSMYFDEDGDLAHEFYEEVSYDGEDDSPRTSMLRIQSHHLRPQGEVDLPIPRINYNLPFIICEAPPR